MWNGAAPLAVEEGKGKNLTAKASGTMSASLRIRNSGTAGPQHSRRLIYSGHENAATARKRATACKLTAQLTQHPLRAIQFPGGRPRAPSTSARAPSFAVSDRRRHSAMVAHSRVVRTSDPVTGITRHTTRASRAAAAAARASCGAGAADEDVCAIVGAAEAASRQISTNRKTQSLL